jgi:hypothetical protein
MCRQSSAVSKCCCWCAPSGRSSVVYFTRLEAHSDGRGTPQHHTKASLEAIPSEDLSLDCPLPVQRTYRFLSLDEADVSGLTVRASSNLRTDPLAQCRTPQTQSRTLQSTALSQLHPRTRIQPHIAILSLVNWLQFPARRMLNSVARPLARPHPCQPCRTRFDGLCLGKCARRNLEKPTFLCVNIIIVIYAYPLGARPLLLPVPPDRPSLRF